MRYSWTSSLFDSGKRQASACRRSNLRDSQSESSTAFVQQRHVAPRLAHWSSHLGVATEAWGIRPMKTKWGSCNPDKKIVWLNLELSKKPARTIDYVLLHELAHLISPRHDERFLKVLDDNMPRWRSVRAELNQYPLAAWNELPSASQYIHTRLLGF
ncbi:M48 family metallopeptidase [Leisingera sp. S232]|uniref:M48 family metallopeptidase n=1 Tax=Leisingera sp. S232 TaxID=3415132 RepID=UPI003C7A8F71